MIEMLPAISMRETSACYAASLNQWRGNGLAESLAARLYVVIPCNDTNSSGTTKRSAGPRLLSAWLDRVWVNTGTTATPEIYTIATPTSADWSSAIDKPLALLEAAAVAGNLEQFTAVFRSIDLASAPENDMVHIAQLALNCGAATLAREACEQGLKRFPNNRGLGKMQTIFAPPRITISTRQPSTGTRANTQWLADHGDAYRGKWVALRAGELVAVANSVDALLKITGDVKGTGIFITPIH
jgi:hypothetical protein